MPTRTHTCACVIVRTLVFVHVYKLDVYKLAQARMQVEALPGRVRPVILEVRFSML